MPLVAMKTLLELTFAIAIGLMHQNEHSFLYYQKHYLGSLDQRGMTASTIDISNHSKPHRRELAVLTSDQPY